MCLSLLLEKKMVKAMNKPVFYVDTNMIIKLADCKKFESQGIDVVKKLKGSSGIEQAQAIYEIYKAVVAGKIIPCILPKVYGELALESIQIDGTYKHPISMEIVKEYCKVLVPDNEERKEFDNKSKELFNAYRARKLFPKINEDRNDCLIMAQATASNKYKLISLKNIDIEHFLTLEEQINRNASNLVVEAAEAIASDKVVTTNIDDFVRFKVQEGRNTKTAREVIREVNAELIGEDVVPLLPSEYVETDEFKQAVKSDNEMVENGEVVKDNATAIEENVDTKNNEEEQKVETNEEKAKQSEKADDGM